MIIVIQICFVLMIGFLAWCEHSPFFANTIKSIFIRLVVATSLIGLCYQVKYLEYQSYETQFSAMIIVLLFVVFSIITLIKRWTYNKKRLEKLNSIMQERRK